MYKVLIKVTITYLTQKNLIAGTCFCYSPNIIGSKMYLYFELESNRKWLN